MATSTIQYIVVRKDLIKQLKWSVGAVIAQACHACTAVIHLYHDDPVTKEYTADLDRMHMCVLEAQGEENLQELHKELTNANIDHKLWIEQPENIPTCLVSKPYRKQDVQAYFKKFKLYR